MLKATRSLLVLAYLLLPFLVVSQASIVKGKITDKQSGEPIEYASITLHAVNDSSMINGVISNQTGNFSFENINEPVVFISAQFLGYETYTSEPFQVESITDLGNIVLGFNSSMLDEIEVTGKAITSSHKLDKQTYDAKQFQNAQGGSANDVLSNLPSVSINSFGEISVRGTTGFMVMINGKPVQTDPAIILGQLSANAIEDIEIITAPSAKYDPDGNAGIINILTKKNLVDGFYLLANTLVGLPSIEDYDNASNTPRYGADLTLNYKKDRWDISAALDYRRYDISGRREGYVNTFIDGVLTEFPSDGERSFDEENYSARLSTTFVPTQKQALTAGFYFGKRTKERTADILYKNQQRVALSQSEFLGTASYYDQYLNSGDVLQSVDPISSLDYFNENLRVRKGDFLITSLDYVLGFDDKSSLKISGLYERTILGGPTDNASLDPNTGIIKQLQFNTNDNPLEGFRFQLDYTKPIGTTSWESGYQYRYLDHPGDFDYFDRDLVNNFWIENPLFTNGIELTRKIHAAYSQVSGSLDKFQYSAGLRLEYFDRSVTIDRPMNTFKLDKVNLFPSLNLSYELSEGLTAKGGYSRRIQRTTTFKMTPFPEREHSETLEQGDAELLPEYIDIVEAGLAKTWGDNSAFGNIYYRKVNNVINRVNTVFNDTILNRIYTNVGIAEVVGLELGTTIYPASKFKVFLGANIYSYGIKGKLFGDDVNTTNTQYSINTNTTLNVSPSFTAQLSLNYLSERITAQGIDSRFYNPSLSLRKSFLNKKVNVSLLWRNMDLGILDSNEQRITTVKDNFFTTTNYVYEVDIIQLNFSYQLNQLSNKIKLTDSEFGKGEF